MPAVPHLLFSDRSLMFQSMVAARAAADFEQGLAMFRGPVSIPGLVRAALVAV